LEERLNTYFFSVFLLQFEQAFCTQAAIIQFGYVLYFVNTKLHHTALAFGIRICLALNSTVASLARNDFVFGAMDV
jgi:hypothetical protein